MCVYDYIIELNFESKITFDEMILNFLNSYCEV